MRAGKLSKPGRILVYLMSFLVAFSSISTFCLEAIYAATNTVNIRGEEELRSMLSVGSIIDDDWANDDSLKELLNERDLAATEYSKENNLLGAYTKSEVVGDYEGSRHWLSNVMYEGTVLRTNSFDGFILSYNDADAAIIKEGLNVIDVIITPVIDTTISADGSDNDISNWDMQYGFASRFMLPHWSTSDEGLKLKDGWGYHTKLFIVGITNKDGEENRIYSGEEMSYVEFLSYIGADPTPANLQSYLDYSDTFNNIKRQRDNRTRSIQQWLEWQRLMNDSNDNDSHHDHHHSDDESGHNKQDPTPDPGPVEEEQNRVIMVYMDVSDLTASAKDNLEEMIKASKGLSGHTRIYVLTGGAKAGDSVRVEDVTGEKEIVYSDCNKLWEVRNGELIELDTYRKDKEPYYPDMSKDETLTSFIQNAIKYDEVYDQDNILYDLILWSHAGGPGGGFGSENRSNADDIGMPLKDIVKALQESGTMFDFVAFDACLMSNAEVALALAPYADYFLGAETVQPGDGLDYTTLIQTLKDDPYIKTLTGDSESGYEGLAKIIVDSVYKKYNKKSDVTYSVLDLKSMIDGEQSDAFWKALNEFSNSLSSYLYKIENNKLKASNFYTVLIQRNSSLVPESMVGRYNDGLIDLISLCESLSNANINELKDVCENLINASKNIKYSISAYSNPDDDGTDGGSVPNGLSVYFPGLWRRYSSAKPDLTVKDEIERLLKVYRETSYQGDPGNAVKESYRKALASYGLWLSTGELMRYYWNDLNPDGSIKASWENDTTTALSDQFMNTTSTEWQMALGNDASTIINKVIEQQINDCIKKSEIRVEDSGDNKTLTVTSVNPDFVDRTEINVSVNINSGDYSGNNASLGYTRDYSSEKTPGNTSVSFTLTKFDNNWFQIGDQIVSYYDTDRIDDKRRGYIPVGYWTSVGKIDGHETTKIKDAIKNGQLNLGMFLVEFDDDDTVGRIVSYRALTNDDYQSSTYTVSNGEHYEMLANFDKAFDENGEYNALVSLGTFTVSDAVRKDNGDGTKGDIIVQLKPTPNLSSTYEIVDIYESRYELNKDNFGEESDNNLDSFNYGGTTGTVAANQTVTVQKNTNDDHKEDDDRSLSSEDAAVASETAAPEAAPADISPSEITPPTLIPLTGDPEADALIAQQNAEAMAAYQAEVLAAQTAQIAAIQESVEAAQNAADTTGIAAADITGITAEAVQGLDTEANVITNPLTGEAVSVSETGVANQDGNTTNETEYVTAGLGEESSAGISESENSSGGDTGSGDSGDGGSDGDSSGSDGGDSGSDDGDSGSDSGSSDSDSSSESSAE